MRNEWSGLAVAIHDFHNEMSNIPNAMRAPHMRWRIENTAVGDFNSPKNGQIIGEFRIRDANIFN